MKSILLLSTVLLLQGCYATSLSNESQSRQVLKDCLKAGKTCETEQKLWEIDRMDLNSRNAGMKFAKWM